MSHSNIYHFCLEVVYSLLHCVKTLQLPSGNYPAGFAVGSLLPSYSPWATRALMHTVFVAARLSYASIWLFWG